MSSSVELFIVPSVIMCKNVFPEKLEEKKFSTLLFHLLVELLL
jgi:hypothetical protein